MHDLVHDLARSVIGDELLVIDAAGKAKTSKQKYCRYALLIKYDGQTKLSDILPKKVRALHFSCSSKLGPRDGSFSSAKRLCILDFSECYGIHLPCSIGQLKQLRCLISPKLQDMSLPETIAQLSKLQYLNLRGSSLISALPESIGKLSCMVYLGLSGCSGILKVPGSFGELKSLVHLDMSNCSGINGLPDSLGGLTKLQRLDLSGCSGVKEIPESLCGLNQLHHLNLSYCDSITKLPEAIGSLNNLQYLDLKSNEQIRELPGSFQNLQNLVHLDMSGCGRTKGLSESLRGLTTLGHLNVSDFGIDYCLWEDLSDAMGNLKNLKYLNVSGGGCSPYFIGTLTNLEHLVLSRNFLMKSLPDSIGNLKNLHTLDLSMSSLKSLPHSIGNLKKLQTLDLSGCAIMKSLPNSIGNLKKLRTLDLSSCHTLKSLPDSISEITVLKSLLIEGCSDELIEQTNSKLHYSLTLPLFNVLADGVSACSNLPLLEGTNVGELRIRSLENVRSLEEARKVKLLDKDKLSDLVLDWTPLDAYRFVDDKDLLGQLVPPRGLKSWVLKGYSGQSFPSWFTDISRHLPNLVNITLSELPKCNNLPPLGRLPNLEELSLKCCNGVTKIGKDFCGGKGAFRRLSEFVLWRMKRLEEWCTTYSVVDGVEEEFMFPVLDRLEIMSCPRLRLKPCPPVCRKFRIEDSNNIISSLEELGNNVGHLTSSTPTTELIIVGCDFNNLRLFHHFAALQELAFAFCDLTSLPENMRDLKSLRSLQFFRCKYIYALPDWLGDLSSLKSLTIHSYTGIKSLPPCIQQLTNLQTLQIGRNPELKRWCESEENKKKVAHINDIIYEDCGDY